MVKAFLRLGLITVATLILTVFAVFFVRNLGLKQQFAAPPHDWFQNLNWTLVEVDAESVCTQPPQPSEHILVLPIHRTTDRWEIACPEKLTLPEFFPKTTHRDWLLSIDVTDNTAIDRFIEELSAFENSKRFAIVGRSQNVLRAIRKKAPQFLYAADAQSMVRLHMFSSLYLETVFDFWPDFVILDESDNPKATHKVNEREEKELLRRQKRIVRITKRVEITP